MRAEHDRDTLSAEWLQGVSEDLIVARGEPRAVGIDAHDRLAVASAGDMSLLANANDGRLSIGGDELFVYSADVRLSEPADGQSNAASSPVDAGQSYRIRVVLSASDAYYADKFAWNGVIEMAIAWIGFGVMATVVQYYSARSRAQERSTAIPLRGADV